MSVIIKKTDEPILLFDDKKKISYWHSHKAVNTTKKLSSISLFTGGGGLDLGLEWAGFQTVAYVEKDRHCINTIRRNRPDWKLVKSGDITEVSPHDILATARLKTGEVSLVAGGAPCQPFSSLGKNEGEQILSGQLYRYFIDVVKHLQPSMFIFENVKGMVQNHKKVIDFMLDEFGELGYGLSTALLCSADYGVPQKRYRVFLIGRKDGKQPGFPLPTHAKNPEQELLHLKNLCLQNNTELPIESLKPWVKVGDIFKSLTSSHYQRPDSKHANLAPHITKMITHILPGTKMNWKSLPEEVKFNCWKTDKFQGNDNFSRLQEDEPSVTIRTGAIYPAKGRYIHPNLNRGLNTIEMAALQSFPLDLDPQKGWFFTGGITSIARQIGNAVPPLLAQAIGQNLYKQILDMHEQ